jgi:hypothetical protein
MEADGDDVIHAVCDALMVGVVVSHLDAVATRTDPDGDADTERVFEFELDPEKLTVPVDDFDCADDPDSVP